MTGKGSQRRARSFELAANLWGMSKRRRPITLEDAYLNEKFKHRAIVSPQWLKDGKRLSYLLEVDGVEFKSLWMFDAGTGKSAIAVSGAGIRISKGRKPGITNYCWSPDEKHLLFHSDPPTRFSGQGDYFLYSMATRKMRRLTRHSGVQRNAKFSPDGRLLGFVRDDDLWTLDLQSGKERRLTRLAKPQVYVGRFGWVYEEELGLVDGWAWSPDGKRIAFFLVDERRVPEYIITDYSGQHPTYRKTRYPKAGDPNPIVSIHVLKLATRKRVEMQTRHEADGYLARMQWSPTGKLLIQRMPRLQNRIDLLTADPNTGKCRVILTDTDDRWVDPQGDIQFTADGFLWLSSRDGRRHIYRYDKSGKNESRLTKGDFDIQKIHLVSDGTAYATASIPSPTERNLVAVPLDGGTLQRLTRGEGHHEATPSPSHYLDVHSDLNTPSETSVFAVGGGKVATLIEPTIPATTGYEIARWKLLTIKTRDGQKLHARMLKPVGFDAAKRYPVLMHTYGGPGSQVVMNRWGDEWLSQHLASKGIIIFMVDGRGSGGQGTKFEKITYLNLGKWEAHDQIEGARWLARQSYVDGKRIGIWGWSYGGYLSSLTAFLGGDTFKVCMSGAPVTHYELYDTIYTERYMRTPAENPDGYREGAPFTHAHKLQAAMLIVHGLADDNVHFQNSVRLVEALQKAQKSFQVMFYPGMKHGPTKERTYIYREFARFLKANL